MHVRRRVPDFTNADPDPDTPEEVAALRKSVTDLGTACERKGGELAAHVSTEEAARDMDVVRGLLGRKKMDWFGASYGTQLGATYATLFPKTVGRMVLDGAVDPALGVIDSASARPPGSNARSRRSPRTASRGPTARSAGTRCRARQDRRPDAELDETPMETRDPARELTEGLAFYGIAVTLYDKGTWRYLGRA